jgi:thiamine-monophosphate kinase
MAVNLSDIAAMGARPRQAFLALAAPGAMAVAVLDAVLEGFEEEGRRHGTALLGGDSCTSPGPLVLAVTVIGEGEPGKLVFRDGSRPGDVIYSTGTLGDAAAGLLLLERGCELDGDDRRALVAAHLSPHAALDEGEWLAASGAVTAMIDLSDGLATDLRHLLDESGGLGAVVEAERVALSAALKAVSFELDEDPLALAFTGGEDYRLLLTVQPERAGELEAAYRLRFASPLVELGRVTGDGRLQLRRGGQLTPLEGHGFEHWRA